MTEPCAHALDHWGDYDRDHPFPLFAEVRAAGPVHDVTLADGHRAFLVVGYAAAREALNHPDLSKDMLAALAAMVQSSRKDCPDRTSRSTCSASTRLTTPACGGWPRRRSPGPGWSRSSRASGRSWPTFSTSSQPR